MSSTRLINDTCAVENDLKRSVGAGNYFVGAPRQDCQTCFPANPGTFVKQVNLGPIQNDISGSKCQNVDNVEISSRLLGLSTPLTKCKEIKKPVCEKLIKKQECPRFIGTEDTRLSNPPSTLKGTGWNRWEWLCKNPQKNIFVPFDFNISNRIVAKDNHRPVIPTPINQSPSLPPLNFSDEPYVSPWMHCKPKSVCNSDESSLPSGVYWRKCDTINKY